MYWRRTLIGVAVATLAWLAQLACVPCEPEHRWQVTGILLGPGWPAELTGESGLRWDAERMVPAATFADFCDPESGLIGDHEQAGVELMAIAEGGGLTAPLAVGSMVLFSAPDPNTGATSQQRLDFESDNADFWLEGWDLESFEVSTRPHTMSIELTDVRVEDPDLRVEFVIENAFPSDDEYLETCHDVSLLTHCAVLMVCTESQGRETCY